MGAMKLLAALLPLAALMHQVTGLVLTFDEVELKFILDMQEVFFQGNGQAGFIEVNGENIQVLPAEAFAFLEGPLRFEFEFNNINAQSDPNDISAKVRAVMQRYVDRVEIANQNTFSEVITNIILNDPANALGQIDDAFDDLLLVGGAGVLQDNLPLGPNVFCLFDTQCQGVREQKNFGERAERECEGNPQRCSDFVAFFTLRWLLVLILATYGIIVLWALYWIYPWAKKKFGKGKAGARAGAGSNGPYSEQDQLIINTLAAQCAAAENLLFQATDMKKQAISMQNIVAVEAKRESKIMVYTVEYFQCCCAIIVALTHSYLDRKTNTPGEKWNIEDATTRALQLEVLNYVRDRLSLAFNADAMTDKSLYRIAEAYAVLKKISDSLVFVGFSYDHTVAGSLSSLKTPFVEFSEDAIFLGGVYKPTMQIPGGESYANSPVCVAMEGASRRDMPAMSSGLYLANQQRDAKIYDPQNMSVKPGVGKALGFSTMNQAQTGEGLQFFVRTFWANEIEIIQGEAQRWLSNNGALENFLENERLGREGRASPVVQNSQQPKKRRKKRKHRNKDKDTNSKYTESNDGATEYTDETGWSVAQGNNYVYNVNAVVAQGLGIAGKPGLPYDKPGETPIKKGSKLYATFEYYFPNYAEWPKFYTLVFVIIPIAIALPMLAKIGKGAGAVDIDGNVDFKARVAGFGTSYLGVPAYYFLDGFVPDLEDLEADPFGDFQQIVDLVNDPFENANELFISNLDAADMFLNDFDGASGRKPEDFIAEIQAGILAQEDVEGLTAIRNQQLAQETTTMLVYALMHNAGYFFGLIPLTLVRESLEILARRFNFIRSIYPLSQWRELHMSMGLAGIYYVAFGATVFLVTALVAIGRSTPFAGLAGDPNIGFFFDLSANVLYIRQFLLPAVPLLFLMKYAARGPPRWMRKYAPTIVTLNYWEICYFLHYFTALTAIIILVIYRPQVFYWMGATWGFVWGGNKIVRILRTRKTTINNVNLVSYTVEDKRNNGKKRSDVLRITLNVPSSFPSSSRGQACWLTCPNVDYIAHPFTLAKVPTETDKTIMFHIAVRYLAGDDVISYAKPDETSKPPPKVMTAPPADPNALPPNWKSAVDPGSGQTYYYNSIEGKTTWTQPKSSGVDRIFDGVRGITTRMSANILRGGSARFGAVGGMRSNTIEPGNTKTFAVSERPSWTQKFANLAYRLQTMDPDLRRNAVKNFPVYVSAPLGTSMDDCLLPSLPGSIIITTQNGLPAGESSVRWLLKQDKSRRPKFHFFVSVSREVNDALSVVQTLRDGMCESVAAGHLNIDGLSGRYSHMVDWLGVYMHLTRRKGSQIEGDRDMLMRSMNPPKAQVTDRQLELINTFIRSRVMPGRLPFDRFLARTQQMVRKRCGVDNMAVGYCGSSVVAHNIRAACRRLERVHFDGEYI